MKTFVASILLRALSIFFIEYSVAEEPLTKSDSVYATLSWGVVVDRSKGDPGGKGDATTFAYYWNGEFIGNGEAAFESLYERIEKFSGERIVYRRETGEKGGLIEKYNDPFFAENNFHFFRFLMSGKQITLEIVSKSALPPSGPEPGYNPFAKKRPSANDAD